ncbi:apiosidase-like domain-containing protein [Cyclobacterium xiamenense]|uniref:apiosidase-like domain-containing protein n=1 Tax=Cyclobacterium xiamenense TaxID=1297121 RepID=UPI001F50F8ED|nr:DUF4038 domain-containing protein [Cyclobacterium xiamenense]
MDGESHHLDPAFTYLPMKPLRITANRRYLETTSGDPFLWVGDTAWELIHRASLDETRLYFRNRKEKGFSLIQTVILAELDGLHHPNAHGEIPLHDDDPARPNEGYFRHVDQVVALAEEMGLYLGLLPTWGDKFNKKWGDGPEIFTPENARSFGEFLGKRYAGFPHIVWILGGDRIPETSLHREIIEQMAAGIRDQQGHSLLSYHPNGGNLASDHFGDSDWLDVDLFQSRHQKGFREYRFTRKGRKRNPPRPVIDGEPGYENIPNMLNKWHFQRLDASDIRRAAYWNLLSGAAGHTYGCNEIWQMYDGKTDPRFGAQFSWKEALDLPGASQMGVLRRIFDCLPWQQMEPAPSLIASINWKVSPLKTVLANPDKSWVLVYSPQGKSIRIRSSLLKKREKVAFWLNPETGEQTDVRGKLTAVFRVPDPRRDWLLLLLDRDSLKNWVYTPILES